MQPENPHGTTVDIRDYLRPIWRRPWLIVLIVFAATALTYQHYSSEPKLYSATTTLYFTGSPLDNLLGGIGIAAGDRYTKDESILIPTPAVARAAAQVLHYKGDPNALLGGISATPETGSDFVQISSEAVNPREAAALANAFARGFVNEQSNLVRVQAEAALVSDEHQLPGLTGNAAQQMVQNIHSLQSIVSLPGTSVSQVAPAPVPGAPISPHPSRNAEFAFFISLLLAIGMAYGLDRLDRRIRRVDDIDPAYGFPVIAEIPREFRPSPVLAGVPALPDHLREPFRALRTNLQLASIDRPLKTILITSAVANEGKSTVVRNLALAYAESGLRVAVVECDLRNHTLHKLFEVETRPGLADVLVGAESTADALQEVMVRIPSGVSTNGSGAWSSSTGSDDVSVRVLDAPGSLYVMTSGSGVENPSVLLAGQRMRATLQELADEFDLVLIDSPGLLSVSDAVSLAPAVDGILLVSRLGKSTTVLARRLHGVIERIPGAHVVGIVANGASRAGHTDYGYGSHD